MHWFPKNFITRQIYSINSKNIQWRIWLETFKPLEIPTISRNEASSDNTVSDEKIRPAVLLSITFLRGLSVILSRTDFNIDSDIDLPIGENILRDMKFYWKLKKYHKEAIHRKNSPKWVHAVFFLNMVEHYLKVLGEAHFAAFSHREKMISKLTYVA